MSEEHYPRDHVIGAPPRDTEPTPRTIKNAVRTRLREVYGHEAVRSQLPAGLRLEIHPAVYHRVLLDSEALWDSGHPDQEPLEQYFTVPVKVTTDLPTEAIALDRAAELPATEIEPAQLAAMAPRERLVWAWGVIGSTDVTKACTLLASLGAPIDASHARTIRRKLAESIKVPALEGGQSS